MLSIVHNGFTPISGQFNMSNTSNPVIETHSLSFGYNRNIVLNNINMIVPAGSIFGFLGPNGAGKSTTIKTLLGLLKTQDGMIELFGKNLNTNRISILRKIGAMVESPSLYDHLNARQNLEFTARLRGLNFSNINSLLDTVSLSRDAHRAVKQYSTGMKQRLSLATAMLADPELLILDEPINGLDPNGIMEIRQLLVRINEERKCTILLSSHILTEIEKLCSDIAIINAGSLVFQGPMQTLLSLATGKETMRIACNDCAKAAEVLQNICSVSKREQSIEVIVKNKQHTAEIIRILISNGVDVYSAEHENSGLESSFLLMLSDK